jgi:hypothetical protein
MGAYLSFTCGHPNTKGGLAAQLGKPADQDLFIGIKPGPRHAPGPLKVLPFFDGAEKLTPQSNFTPEAKDAPAATLLQPYAPSQVTRRYGHATDEFQTPDFNLRLFTPFGPIPDPATASPEELRNALLPAITAELDIDNSAGSEPLTAFFAINFHDGGCRLLEQLAPHQRGFAFRADLGFAAESSNLTLPLHPLLRWSVEEALTDINPVHLLGQCPGIALEVPAGQRATLRLALGCYLAHPVTTRLEARYLYARYYQNLEDVLATALARFDTLKQQSHTLDEKLLNSRLSPDQQFLIAHATRSYYANTQLLDLALTNTQPAHPYWIVNEGEYCMMNTLDLAADQVFWELEQNPWVVKNLLDNFLKHYSYTDEVKTTENTEGTETTSEKSSVLSVSSLVKTTSPGGVSFTHDQGTHNQFSPFGQSAYELPNLTGCFSFMTAEQLCNWILIAATYVDHTSDNAWILKNEPELERAYLSLRSRGIHRLMEFDSSYCGAGQEITTYDSLDPSLGQARASLYLAVKFWAAYLALELVAERLFRLRGETNIALHGHAFDGSETFSPWDDAETAADQICAHHPHDGSLQALFEVANPAHAARILSAIEALTFLSHWRSDFTGTWLHLERGPYSKLLAALRTHTQSLLADPARRNHFPDRGIRLSSTSDNSWLSKIALVQHVARSLFHLDENGNTLPPQSSALRTQSWPKADAAHVRWLTTGPGAYWCACDQIVNGIARGSKYYPRLITTTLWLHE